MMERKLIPTELKDLIRYDEKTGLAFWNEAPSKSVKAGSAISTLKNGYIVFSYKRSQYLLHRVIWFIMKGEQPSEIIDHKNRMTTDNKWSNLREATYEESSINTSISSRNSSGYKGVYWNKRKNRYIARIGSGNKRKVLGQFVSEKDAAIAYDNAALKLYGPNYPNFNMKHETIGYKI